MCGIVGAVAKVPVVELLIEGLKRLEYRGYDSAGVAVVNESQSLQRLRAVGKVRELSAALTKHTLSGHTGIAHTRWATHGVPSEANAHPLLSHDAFAVVHNGIIENHETLRAKLKSAGYLFTSETDTEVVAHLIHFHAQTTDFLTAVSRTVDELKGAYALGIICAHYPQQLIAVRHGSPLVIGRGVQGNFIASDPLALLSAAEQFIYLEDGDIASLTPQSIQVVDKEKLSVEREWHTVFMQAEAVERGEHRHYMKKEILEQPEAIKACLNLRLEDNHLLSGIFGEQAESIFSNTEHIHLVACGTSYHAALVARYWLEELAGIPCTVEIASEFRYRVVTVPKNCLYVTLSQSGETADTLSALKAAKKMNYLTTLAICNVAGSSMLRESALLFLIKAGVEIGVASTKAFTNQLIALMLFALTIAKVKSGSLAAEKRLVIENLLLEMTYLPERVQVVLQINEVVMEWARTLHEKQHVLFLGRGLLYPIALEGALKLKEISYIHAEGYAAGELKHGPLALVDSALPIIALAPSGVCFDKMVSNMQEVLARGGNFSILTDQPEALQQSVFSKAKIIHMPTIHPLLSPVLYTIPLQLLAYHVAVHKGTDVDQPRNLAKSVTVE